MTKQVPHAFLLQTQYTFYWISRNDPFQFLDLLISCVIHTRLKLIKTVIQRRLHKTTSVDKKWLKRNMPKKFLDLGYPRRAFFDEKKIHNDSFPLL